MKNILLEENLEQAVTLLKALANEKRLLIMCALIREEKCVGELEQIVGLSQSALSQHLARLRRDELVATRRDAQTIYYSCDNEMVKRAIANLDETFHICGADKE